MPKGRNLSCPDIIMSRAYWGREGDAVCEMDRDGEL